jgi:hypothetical protein
MTVMPNLSCRPQELPSRTAFGSIEQIVRLAIELGEISPGAERQVQSLLLNQELAERDRHLVGLLQDAMATGYVQRIGRANQ